MKKGEGKKFLDSLPSPKRLRKSDPKQKSPISVRVQAEKKQLDSLSEEKTAEKPVEIEIKKLPEEPIFQAGQETPNFSIRRAPPEPVRPEPVRPELTVEDLSNGLARRINV